MDRFAKLLASEEPDVGNRLLLKVSAMCSKAAMNQPKKKITMGAR